MATSGVVPNGGLQSGAVFEEQFTEVKALLSREFFPLDLQASSSSYRVPNTRTKGHSSVFINNVCHERNHDKIYDKIHPSLDTTDKALLFAEHVFPDQKFLGCRRVVDGKSEPVFTSETYRTIARRRVDVAAGVLHLLETNEFLDFALDGFILTLYSKNRVEWALADIACQGSAITTTALYDTLGPESSQYILALTESPIVVCSKDKIKTLLSLKPQLPHLISIVSMDPLEDDVLIREAYANKIKLIDFEALELLGSQNPRQKTPPTPDTVMTISFTSGTTGKPKGVVLTHRAVAAAVAYGAVHLEGTKGHATVYSFLPLAHIFERMNLINYALLGAHVCFPNETDTPLTLVENLKILKPTALVGVPRLFNRLESVIKSRIEGRTFIQGLIDKKIALQEARDGRFDTFLADKFVLSKIRSAIGFDNVEWVISGSAPINKSTVKFLKAALNIGFSQGYGATEVCAGVSITGHFDRECGDVGAIGSSSMLRLKSLPELNYNVVDANGEELEEPCGEILLKSVQMFSCYYKEPELTKEAFDDDGWYRTGDVARIDKHGKIHIIDRVKNFFKLSQGEFVVPEKVENIYLSNNSFLSQLYIHGDADKSHIIGVAGIDLDFLKSKVQQHHHAAPLAEKDLQDSEIVVKLANTPNVKKAILAALNNPKVSSQLSGFEKLHNIHIDIEPLKLEHDIITPTFKIKRPMAKKFFESVIAKLYEEGSLIGSKLKL